MSAVPALASDTGENRSANGPILLDAHGHFYDCFDAAEFLDRAAANMARAGAALGLGGGAPGHLVIASTVYGDGLETLVARAGGGEAGAWRIAPTDEPESFLASRAGGAELVLLAGRQITTAERIEVLAVACAAPLADGLGLRETVAAAREAGAVVVVPWGFGKWWFERGRAVRGLLESESGSGVFLGDSANRPQLSPTPALMRLGAERGVRNLPGSDPLRLRFAAGCAGRFGCVVDAPFDPRRPAAALRRALADPGVRPTPFGRRVSLAWFVRSQGALRLARGSAAGVRA